MQVKEYSRTKNSILNMATGLVGQITLTLLRFASRTVFIYVLGAEYLGIGGLFSNILTLLSLSELGVGSAIIFKLYKPMALKDERRVKMLVKFFKRAYTAIGIIFLLLGILMIPLLPVLIKNYHKLDELGINAPFIFFLYLMQSVSTYLFSAYRTVIIKTAMKRYIINVVGFIYNILTVGMQIAILVCPLGVFSDKPERFMLYVGLVIILGIFQNWTCAIIATKMYPWAFKKEKESLSRQEQWGIVKDCAALLVYKVNGVVLKATDNLVISYFLGLRWVGLYSNYFLIYLTINQFVKHFHSGVKESMGNAYAKESLEKNYFIFELMNFITILLKGTACVGIAICSNELIDLWVGKEFIIPQPLPLLLGIESLFFGLKVNLGQARNISGAFRQAWYRPLMGIVINLVVSIVLCYYIGICGVIIGTITADILTNFLIDPFIIHKYSYKGYKPASFYYKKNLTYMFILAVVGIADYLVCRVLVTGLPIIDFVMHVLICLISVPVTLMLIYKNTDVCRYLFERMKSSKWIQRHKHKQS